MFAAGSPVRSRKTTPKGMGATAERRIAQSEGFRGGHRQRIKVKT